MGNTKESLSLDVLSLGHLLRKPARFFQNQRANKSVQVKLEAIPYQVRVHLGLQEQSVVKWRPKLSNGTGTTLLSGPSHWDLQNKWTHRICQGATMLSFGPLDRVSFQSPQGCIQGTCMPLTHYIQQPSYQLGFGFCLDYSIKNNFTIIGL